MERFKENFERVKGFVDKIEVLSCLIYITLSILVIKSLALWQQNYIIPDTQIYITQQMYNQLLYLIIGVIIIVAIGYFFIIRLYKKDKEKDLLLATIVELIKEDREERHTLNDSLLESLMINRKLSMKSNKELMNLIKNKRG